MCEPQIVRPLHERVPTAATAEGRNGEVTVDLRSDQPVDAPLVMYKAKEQQPLDNPRVLRSDCRIAVILIARKTSYDC